MTQVGTVVWLLHESFAPDKAFKVLLSARRVSKSIFNMVAKKHHKSARSSSFLGAGSPNQSVCKKGWHSPPFLDRRLEAISLEILLTRGSFIRRRDIPLCLLFEKSHFIIIIFILFIFLHQVGKASSQWRRRLSRLGLEVDTHCGILMWVVLGVFWPEYQIFQSNKKKQAILS